MAAAAVSGRQVGGGLGSVGATWAGLLLGLFDGGSSEMVAALFGGSIDGGCDISELWFVHGWLFVLVSGDAADDLLVR